ncbi:MAG TPA: prolyl oligopeptidase family serine peptidase [Chitinophagaceae bacterium]|nr:prolyl oligopeptidase family serine peptidase [Chitinophagaceae bacterium]
MKKYFFSILFFSPLLLLAQKKPLDHSVYDSWQSIGERMISNDGKWVVYTVCPQVGDTTLVIQSSDARYKKEIEHSKNAVITEDSRFAIFKIRPWYKDLREAWIKKKKPDEIPKDSLGIIEFGKATIWKLANVKSYKTPEKAAGWVAYQLEKEKNALKENENSGGSDLILRQTTTGKEKIFKNISEYYFNKTGRKLLLLTAKNPKDSLSKINVLLYDLRVGVMDTLSRGGNDFRNFTMTDDGSQIAYIAERDATPKALQKFYKLWYYKEGMDSAVMLVDKNSVGMMLGMSVSEYCHPDFSKTGKRLFFGTAPIEPPKDTSLIDIDLVKVDIWNYKDDYLQTVQTNPARLRNDLEKNYLAVYDLQINTIRQLGSEKIPQIIETNEGDGDTFIGVTDFGKRVESQWLGDTRKDIYAIDVKTGNKKLVKENLHGFIYPSSTGKYIMWYDRPAKNYFVWDGKTTRNITTKIKVPLWDEDFNNPDDPTPYGVMGWHEGDSAVYVYDKYDIWKVDPTGKENPENYLNKSAGRKDKIVARYVSTDPEQKAIKDEKGILVRRFNDINKKSCYAVFFPGKNTFYFGPGLADYSFGAPIKAKDKDILIYTKESFKESPDLYIESDTGAGYDSPHYGDISVALDDRKLSFLNPQQKDYNWGSAELFHWKTFKGNLATGIVYKPENFDPKKKYPMICYFYEELDNTLNNYIPPAPIRSAINISFFVSRGYIIFVPSIKYDVGHPGKSAYDYVVSGAKALIAKGFVDPKNIAIQGHSWGGYQVAYLVTATNMFKAAWAGAPVANMTSAYGGIRWESGVSRQFQYEKGQSRIGGTLWDKFNLYVENSPLFHLKNVTTPLVIMANDNDGAVPWYQGIELFSAMRRLGKKVWMFDYNGEGHGLTERKDKLDYQIRMQQFFDWILKGDLPAHWITDGVPAVKKGKDWGLEINE